MGSCKTVPEWIPAVLQNRDISAGSYCDRTWTDKTGIHWCADQTESAVFQSGGNSLNQKLQFYFDHRQLFWREQNSIWKWLFLWDMIVFQTSVQSVWNNIYKNLIIIHQRLHMSAGFNASQNIIFCKKPYLILCHLTNPPSISTWRIFVFKESDKYFFIYCPWHRAHFRMWSAVSHFFHSQSSVPR